MKTDPAPLPPDALDRAVVVTQAEPMPGDPNGNEWRGVIRISPPGCAAWHRQHAAQVAEALFTAAREAARLRAENAELRAERDEARGWLASAADRCNTALRESCCSEIVGDVYRTAALRDGIEALYDRGARLRSERDSLRARVRELEGVDAAIEQGRRDMRALQDWHHGIAPAPPPEPGGGE